MAYYFVISWLVAAMLSWVDVPQEKLAMESAFLVNIATDALAVSLDPEETPLFKGETGRIKTALLILSIASFESGYRSDIDSGEVRGDGGESWCLMQVRLPGKSRVVMKDQYYGYSYKTSEGWSGRDLVEDRQKCFRAALHMARESLRLCKNLSIYTTGKCLLRDEPASHARLHRALAWGIPEGVEWSDLDFLE